MTRIDFFNKKRKKERKEEKGACWETNVQVKVNDGMNIDLRGLFYAHVQPVELA